MLGKDPHERKVEDLKKIQACVDMLPSFKKVFDSKLLSSFASQEKLCRVMKLVKVPPETILSSDWLEATQTSALISGNIFRLEKRSIQDIAAEKRLRETNPSIKDSMMIGSRSGKQVPYSPPGSDFLRKLIYTDQKSDVPEWMISKTIRPVFELSKHSIKEDFYSKLITLSTCYLGN